MLFTKALFHRLGLFQAGRDRHPYKSAHAQVSKNPLPAYHENIFWLKGSYFLSFIEFLRSLKKVVRGEGQGRPTAKVFNNQALVRCGLCPRWGTNGGQKGSSFSD
jgi:hypothetical protein